MNQTILIGRLGADPEMRFGNNNPEMAITNFRVAVNRKANGKEFVDWFQVTTFGKLAEICAEHLQKGREVCLTGRMESKAYLSNTQVDGDGNPVLIQALGLIANEVQFLGSSGNGNGTNGTSPTAEPTQPTVDEPVA